MKNYAEESAKLYVAKPLPKKVPAEETITPEMAARYAVVTRIEHDDETALCTTKGHARYRAEHAAAIEAHEKLMAALWEEEKRAQRRHLRLDKENARG